MIHIRVTSLDGRKSINTFPVDFLVPVEDEAIEKKYRYTRKDTEFGKLELLVVDEERITYANKVFKPFATAVEMVLSNSILQAREMADDYLHNIIKIHGNQKSIVERCVCDSEDQASYNDFVVAVQRSLQSKPKEFAEDICALSKEIRLVDYHIGGYKLLRDADKKIAITDNHNLKKFLLGLSHLFFEAFRKNNFVLSLHNINNDFRCSFEYETFNIAMHSFLENAVKYCKPYTQATAYTKNESGELVFEMTSIRLERDEIKTILERGVFGKNVPEDLRGNGIGMYQVDKALNRSKILFTISADLSQASEVNGIKYTPNTFTFKFKTYSS